VTLHDTSANGQKDYLSVHIERELWEVSETDELSSAGRPYSAKSSPSPIFRIGIGTKTEHTRSW